MIKKNFLFMAMSMIMQIEGSDIQQASAERIDQIRGISADKIAQGAQLIKKGTRPAAVGKSIIQRQIEGSDIQQASAKRIDQIRGISADKIAQGAQLIKKGTRPAAVGKSIIQRQSLWGLENMGQRLKGRFSANRIKVQEDTKKIS